MKHCAAGPRWTATGSALVSQSRPYLLDTDAPCVLARNRPSRPGDEAPLRKGLQIYTGRMAGRSTRLRLRVSPGARSNAIVGRHGEGWKVRVTAAPEDGKANDAVLRLLAERLELPIKSVTLVSGPSSRDKIVELTGLNAAEAERRLGQPE
jgi:uncharacterized protein